MKSKLIQTESVFSLFFRDVIKLVCCSCQFVVAESKDYSVHLADPDLMVEWENIEEIVCFKIVHLLFKELTYLGSDSFESKRASF